MLAYSKSGYAKIAKKPVMGVLWLISGRVLEIEILRLPVQASPAALHCVLEQDTLIPAYYWFSPGRPVPT